MTFKYLVSYDIKNPVDRSNDNTKFKDFLREKGSVEIYGVSTTFSVKVKNFVDDEIFERLLKKWVSKVFPAGKPVVTFVFMANKTGSQILERNIPRKVR